MATPASATGSFASLIYRYDSITPAEGISYLLKKSLGIANTKPHGSLLSEASITSYPFIFNTKQYAQTIPLPLPGDFVIDPKFSNFGYTIENGTTCINDITSTRFYSQSYPYIALYNNVLLTAVSLDPIANSVYNGTTSYSSYSHPLLKQSISKYFDPNANYPWTLTTSNGVTIDTADGYWLCDTDSGVITLYDSNTTVSQLSRTNPPRFTFYRYEGLIGANVNIVSTQDL